MPPISISTVGILELLKEVDTKKAPVPDNIPAWVLKHCATEIATILSRLFSQSLNTGHIPHEHQYSKKEIVVMMQTITSPNLAYVYLL